MNAGRTTVTDRLSVIVSDDGLKAWIHCQHTAQTHAPPTAADIVATLESSKISLTSAVRSRVEEYVRLWTPAADATGPREIPTKYLIAEGVAPTEPQEDALELKEQFRQDPKGKQAVGTVDHFARSTIKTVASGMIIGRIRRAEPEAPGCDVFGREISPPRKTNPPFSIGYGLKELPTGEVVAEVSGRLLVENRHLKIEPGLEIRSDVDFDTGSLDVCVDVNVHGTIKSNFRVHTTGSLTVGRAIEAAEVDVDGNLRVQGGICGREAAGRIRAGGTIAARFCNESHVQAGADIRIEAETLNSHVQTPARFRSPEGTLIGGSVWAREGIEAAVLGSEAAVATRVAVGVSLAALREERQLREQMDEHVKLAAQIREKIAPLMANLKRLTPSQREAATELMSRANELDTTVEESQSRRQCLQHTSRPLGTPYILVNLAVHRGVRIAIGGRETRIDNVLHGPVRIEERKIEGATEIVAINQRTASVTVLPSWEIDLSALAAEAAPGGTDARVPA